MRDSTRIPCAVCLIPITGWVDAGEGLKSPWAVARGDKLAIPCGHSVDEIWREWLTGIRQKVKVR